MIITIFRARLRPEVQDDYSAWAQRMTAIVTKMLGYLTHKAFTAQDGERLTYVAFEGEASRSQETRAVQILQRVQLSGLQLQLSGLQHAARSEA